MIAWIWVVIVSLLVQDVLMVDNLPVFSPDRPKGMPEIGVLDVMCYNDKMTVTVKFSTPFFGMVFSKGSYGQPNCIYVPPNTGQTDYKFDILYDKCGTKPDLQGKFYENTIVVQYERDLIELWDEAKRLRCEWANDYRQLTESMPAVKMDDLTVIELNFQGDNVDCWMEIQEGKGPWASHVSGIVPIGSVLTLVVAISDPSGEFDMMVRSCVAHDSVRPPLQLTDERGCILRPKMFSPFQKTKTEDGRASVITYAHFSAFKFPDTMQVNIQCKVVICRHGCPRPCSQDTLDGLAFANQRMGLGLPAASPSGGGMNSKVGAGSAPLGVVHQKSAVVDALENDGESTVEPSGSSTAPSFAEALHRKDGVDETEAETTPAALSRNDQHPVNAQAYFPPPNQNIENDSEQQPPTDEAQPTADKNSQFFQGPRSYRGEEENEHGEDFAYVKEASLYGAGSDEIRTGKRLLLKQQRARKTRSVDDDKELRVSYSYQAISRTDLAFAPNASADSVSVYAGRRSDGALPISVCLSVPSFGALYASLGMFAVTAVLVAVVCGYHYRNFGKARQIPGSASSVVSSVSGLQRLHQHHVAGTSGTMLDDTGVCRTVLQLNTLSRTKAQ